ncbi:MAG: DNA adenine methylase [Candidatus Accumulibacter sp.]|nr:DNA adenine methylase [Accumulibacter sp.]
MEIFRIIQDTLRCRELFRKLRRTPYARSEFESAFLPYDAPVINAQRAIIRAYLSFHHGALFNLKKTAFSNAKHRHGSGNKAHEWYTYPRVLAQVCERFRNVIIENQDALHVIQVQDMCDTLFFVDPPYMPSTRYKSTGHRCELDEGQHVELLDLLLFVKGRVMISGYPSNLYDRMLKGWRRATLKFHAAAGGQSTRTEVLWISPR